MIVDTSAIVAIALNESGRDRLVEALMGAAEPKMSAATLVEVAAVLMRRLKPEDLRRVERLIDQLGIVTVPFDAEQATNAARAYREFGRGSGHRASLNLGDCYSYALASVTGEPLLFVGDDFIHTDITAVALE
ncbi:type II toxin-antitoxin system VapC family toxin [Mycolicibacterium rhodesiae]|uniref:Ribonuclease VapC n=1 Tax=Mycolicibacterium rhodesiae TaxID=36814 RepID=A0A1X0J1U2_MYCRH|nr:type II toxin-antitoxin system VapC family toxin [Mycolicibacterium rhodesiae]MCV7345373.1 type II toxin-antitoxin system VapC family toxin [Mycolicibacterium rhodesiae]ORB54985.1 VapC toxin family PIN domain ribonuclease [Mycolicibacterium rhodesiae]